MIKKIIFLIPLFYFLVLIQTSFLVHFKIFGIVPNLVLITVIFIALLEKPKEKLSITSAFIGGFFLDIFSENFIGFYLLICLTIVLFIKFILKKHVQIPKIRRV